MDKKIYQKMAGNVLRRGTGFSSLTIGILGNYDVTGCSAIEYKVEQEKQNNYGIGGNPVSRSAGAKKYSGAITLADYEIRGILNADDDVESLVDVAPFDIVVSSTANGEVTSDVLEQCEFLEDSFSAAVGDTNIEISLPIIIGGIRRGVK